MPARVVEHLLSGLARLRPFLCDKHVAEDLEDLRVAMRHQQADEVAGGRRDADEAGLSFTFGNIGEDHRPPRF